MDQIYFNAISHHKLDIILFIVFTIIKITKSETTEGDLFKNKQQQNKQKQTKHTREIGCWNSKLFCQCRKRKQTSKQYPSFSNKSNLSKS